MSLPRNNHALLHWCVRVALLAFLVLASAWALWPERVRASPFDLDSVLRVDDPQGEQGASEGPALVASMFDAQLWYEPAVVPAEPTPNEPLPARVNLQLLAITSGTGVSGATTQTAVIYEPDADLIHQVVVGISIGGFVVQRISDTSVELQQGQRIARIELELMEDGP